MAWPTWKRCAAVPRAEAALQLQSVGHRIIRSASSRHGSPHAGQAAAPQAILPSSVSTTRAPLSVWATSNGVSWPSDASGLRSRGHDTAETFDFLGFTHCCSATQRGKFVVLRLTRGKKMRAKLCAVHEVLRKRMTRPAAEQGPYLRSVVAGQLAFLLRYASRLQQPTCDVLVQYAGNQGLVGHAFL